MWFYRVAEVKVELIGNYKRSVMKYKKNGTSVMPVEVEDIKEDSQEDDKETLQNNLKKKILDIPSSDDEQQVSFYLFPAQSKYLYLTLYVKLTNSI